MVFAYNPLVFVENWRQAVPELCGTYMTIGDSKVPVSVVGYLSAAQSGYRAWLDSTSASWMPHVLLLTRITPLNQESGPWDRTARQAKRAHLVHLAFINLVRSHL